MKTKATLALSTAFALFLSSAAAIATPAAAAQQTQEGLVNVQIGDITTGNILSNNNVQVGAAVDVIAQVCNVSVTAAVLTDTLNKSGSYTCKGPTQFTRVTNTK